MRVTEAIEKPFEKCELKSLKNHNQDASQEELEKPFEVCESN